MIRYTTFQLGDHAATTDSIFKFQLSIPDEYILKSCLCTARINTDNLSGTDYWKNTQTPISYSWDKNGLIQVSLLSNANGQGRVVDVISVLGVP